MPTVASFAAQADFSGFPLIYNIDDGTIDEVPGSEKKDVSGFTKWTTLSGFNKDSAGSPSPEQVAQSYRLAVAWHWNVYKLNIDVSVTGTAGSDSFSQLNTRDHARDGYGASISYDPTDLARIAPHVNDLFIIDDEPVAGQFYEAFRGAYGGSGPAVNVRMYPIVTAPIALAEVVRMYDGSTLDEDNFVGYGVFSAIDVEEEDSGWIEGTVTSYANGGDYCQIPIVNSDDSYHFLCGLSVDSGTVDNANMYANYDGGSPSSPNSATVQINSIELYAY